MELNGSDYIHADDKVLIDGPVIKNTRISVGLIPELYAAGWNEQQIFDSYPYVKLEDSRAVFYYLKGRVRKNKLPC